MAEMYVKAQTSDEEGTFDGVLSTYGNLDLVGDICEKGCFDDSLKAHGTKFPLLYQHNYDEPIGSFDVVSADDALRIKGHINMETQRGRETYALLKAGDISGLSIGYSIPEGGYHWDDDGIRHLLKVDLREGSVVTFPANPLATATAKGLMKAMAVQCKGMSAEDRARALDALRSAISSKDGGEEEKPKDPPAGDPGNGDGGKPKDPDGDKDGDGAGDDAGSEDGWEEVRSAVQALMDALDRALSAGSDEE